MIDPGRVMGCDGKQRFAKPRLAHRIAKRMGGQAQVYRCSYCGGWHVGADNNPMKAPKKARRGDRKS